MMNEIIEGAREWTKKAETGTSVKSQLTFIENATKNHDSSTNNQALKSYTTLSLSVVQSLASLFN